MPVMYQFAHARRHKAYSVLMNFQFFWNADAHLSLARLRD
jgi:hypothetical protein